MVHISEEIYSQDLKEAASLGIMTEEEIVQKMVEVGLWSEKEEELASGTQGENAAKNQKWQKN